MDDHPGDGQDEGALRAVLRMHGLGHRYVFLCREVTEDQLRGPGNSVKAGVRFLSYDQFKHMLADSEVRAQLNVCALIVLILQQRVELVHLEVF